MKPSKAKTSKQKEAHEHDKEPEEKQNKASFRRSSRPSKKVVYAEVNSDDEDAPPLRLAIKPILLPQQTKDSTANNLPKQRRISDTNETAKAADQVYS